MTPRAANVICKFLNKKTFRIDLWDNGTTILFVDIGDCYFSNEKNRTNLNLYIRDTLQVFKVFHNNDIFLHYGIINCVRNFLGQYFSLSDVKYYLTTDYSSFLADKNRDKHRADVWE